MDTPATIPPNMRFFHADNCNRHIGGGGFNFEFEAYDQLGGTWRGVLASNDPPKLAALEALSKTPYSAVTEISKDEFIAKLKKKKVVGQDNYNPFFSQALKPVSAPVVGNGTAVVVANQSSSADKPTGIPVGSAAEALDIGIVVVNK